MTLRRTGRRERISIVLLNKPSFDELALKFLVLSLNKIQKCFEFEFQDLEEYPLKNGDLSEIEDIIHCFSRQIEKEELEGDYFVGITSYEIEENHFMVVSKGGDISVITTKGWDKHFAPPSVFEYIIHSLTTALIMMADKTGTMDTHDPIRGCCLDYVYLKENVKVDIPMRYICNFCKSAIKKKLGSDFLECFEKINSFDWLGEVDAAGTVAWNLKKYFRTDLNKDTGLYKTKRERLKDYLLGLPKELTSLSLNTLVAAIMGFIIGLLLGAD